MDRDPTLFGGHRDVKLSPCLGPRSAHPSTIGDAQPMFRGISDCTTEGHDAQLVSTAEIPELSPRNQEIPGQVRCAGLLVHRNVSF
jgi:hypothetical protein